MSFVETSIRVENLEIKDLISGDIVNLENDFNWQEYADAVFTLSDNSRESFKEISLSLCEPSEIQELNREYRSKDYVTDVLSFEPIVGGEFPAEDLEDFDEDEILLFNSAKLLGDIIICPQKAQSQAQEDKRSLKYEIVFLFIHGLLHLLGYDHEVPEEEKIMFDLQSKIISTLAIE